MSQTVGLSHVLCRLIQDLCNVLDTNSFLSKRAIPGSLSTYNRGAKRSEKWTKKRCPNLDSGCLVRSIPHYPLYPCTATQAAFRCYPSLYGFQLGLQKPNGISGCASFQRCLCNPLLQR